MFNRKTCTACEKKKFFVKIRQYDAPTISKHPITSKGELCRSCYKQLKKIIPKQ